MTERLYKPGALFLLRYELGDGFKVSIDSPEGTMDLHVVVTRGERAWQGRRDTIDDAVALVGQIVSEQRKLLPTNGENP